MNTVRVLTDIDETALLQDILLDDTIVASEEITFSRVKKRMSSGKSSVVVSAKMPDGKYVIIELGMSNFEMMAAAFKGAEERANGN